MRNLIKTADPSALGGDYDRIILDTTENKVIVDKYVDPFNGHDYVDLGLPSGTLWATCNVGATKPCEEGLLFQFSRVDGYSYGSALGTTFEAHDGLISKIQYSGSKPPSESGKYYGANSVLGKEDDAAHVNMGGDWRMPLRNEITELIDNTTHTWAKCPIEHEGEHTNKYGMLFTSKTKPNAKLFIPSAGYFNAYDGIYEEKSTCANIWINLLGNFYGDYALNLTMRNNECQVYSYTESSANRSMGYSVRGVIKP